MLASRRVLLAVVVAALGYFVDLYDVVLFSILRVPSLKSIGVPDAQLVHTGALLLDLQLAGMIVGGVVLGVLGDRRGRVSVVFGSIVVYSLANLANALVTSVTGYAALRFVAGFGLAGELGAGITLVAELLPRERRGLGTTVVASVGLTGALAAGLIAEFLLRKFGVGGFRYAYALGGIMGLLLLGLRVGLLESGLYARAEQSGAARGDVRMLLAPAERLQRFVRVVLVGMPIWYVGGVLFIFAPELGGAMGLAQRPTGGNTIFYAYLGVVIGDITSGLLSQRLRSRKRVIGGFLTLLLASVLALLTFGGRSLGTFYGLMCLVGFATGYWVLFVTTASEQFGTNLRATVTTSAPNFVRGTAIPISAVWLALKSPMGVIAATAAVGVVCIAVGFIALLGMRESFDADLDRMEE
jgi:hypothetical protein